MTTPTANPFAVLELRLNRNWRIYLALFVPFMAFIALAAFVGTVDDKPPPSVDKLILVTLLSSSLLGALVLPASVLLVRALRGVPDVRMDLQGLVWGRDRNRDLSIDWGEIGRIVARMERSQYMTDRVFVLHPAVGRTGRPARTLYGRVLAAANRYRYKTPFVISTAANDQPWERVQQALEARLPGIEIELI